MPATIHAPPRRPIARRDVRRGLRRYTMHNEAMAFYDAHPEAWADLMRICDENERIYGPPPPIPPHTRFTLRGEIFHDQKRHPGAIMGPYPRCAA